MGILTRIRVMIRAGEVLSGEHAHYKAGDIHQSVMGLRPLPVSDVPVVPFAHLLQEGPLEQETGGLFLPLPALHALDHFVNLFVNIHFQIAPSAGQTWSLRPACRLRIVPVWPRLYDSTSRGYLGQDELTATKLTYAPKL